MFPENRINAVGARAEFLVPDDEPRSNRRIDKEYGGIGINDVSQGLQYQIWTLTHDVLTGELRLTDENSTTNLLVLTDELIEEVSFSFDQNMQPAIAYWKQGTTHFRWFDTTINSFVTVQYGGTRNPLVSMDEKRKEFVEFSDIIIAYIRGPALRYRIQRERYLIEHLGANLPLGFSTLLGLGKSRNNRFQFYVRTVY